MTNSKKWQLPIALVLTCNLALWSAEEPNDPNRPQIKIELGDQGKSWLRQADPSQAGQGPIRPTHVAEFLISDEAQPSYPRMSTNRDLLEASAAATMSPKQRKFIEDSDALGSSMTRDRAEGRVYRRLYLYAVSEADARKMIEAFIEIRSEKANRRRLEYVTELRKYQEEMAKAKGLLPGKEALLLTGKEEYDKSKEYAHAFSADTEAVEHAKQTMLEMSKMLDTLDVELAGIREKLEVIRTYWSKHSGRTKEADAKLEEIEIIQTIELKGAEARRKAAVAIRKREKDFLDLFDKWTSLDSEVKGLRSTIDNRQKHIAEYEAILANPKPDMLPPQIYQNKVTIYPVRTD
jgi:hypothetical protein